MTDIPSAGPEPERYTGRPLLLVVENYILDCIGELSPDKADELRKRVQSVLGAGADWRHELGSQLQLGEGHEEKFRSLWQRNQEIAKQHKVAFHPVQFAKMVVDTNYAHLLERQH